MRLCRAFEMDIGQPVVDDGNFVLRVSELADDLLLNHPRIRDHMSCAALLEQAPLEFQEFGVFVVREAKEGAPTRFVRNAALQPEFVDTVAGSVAVALHDTIQTKEDLIRSAGSFELLLRTGAGSKHRSGSAARKAIRPEANPGSNRVSPGGRHL